MWIYRKDKHSWVKYWYTFSTGICNSASFKLHIKEHNLSENVKSWMTISKNYGTLDGARMLSVNNTTHDKH